MYKTDFPFSENSGCLLASDQEMLSTEIAQRENKNQKKKKTKKMTKENIGQEKI